MATIMPEESAEYLLRNRLIVMVKK